LIISIIMPLSLADMCGNCFPRLVAKAAVKTKKGRPVAGPPPIRMSEKA